MGNLQLYALGFFTATVVILAILWVAERPAKSRRKAVLGKIKGGFIRTGKLNRFRKTNGQKGKR